MLMHRYTFVYDHGVFEWLFPILMLALLVGLVLMVFWSFRRRPATIAGTDPLRRAAARYANGDIERVEFERIQHDLTSPVATTPLEDAALRLARGDITTEEFDAIRDRLGGDGSG
jgi:uncharacterized membrane protein